jgi:GST-like protein
MDDAYIVYGSPGSGSVPVEAALTLIGAPYEVIGETVLRTVARNPAVSTVNPLGQVPALVLPGGEVMTESAAILIWLADRYPEAGLAPLPSGERRAAFLRWMAYVSSAIYALARRSDAAGVGRAPGSGGTGSHRRPAGRLLALDGRTDRAATLPARR